MKNTPAWFKVLHHFYDNDYFENGLTIPFLLGAVSVINPDDKILSVEEFVLQAADESLPKKISLQRCSFIGEYVFGIIDIETLNYPYGKAVTKQFGNICITDNSFSGITETADLKKILRDALQNLLDSDLYSKNQGKWGGYSATETARIKELK